MRGFGGATWHQAQLATQGVSMWSPDRIRICFWALTTGIFAYLVVLSVNVGAIACTLYLYLKVGHTDIARHSCSSSRHSWR